MNTRRIFIAAALALGATAVSTTGWSQAPAAPVAKVSQGQLRGVAEGDVRVFRGIPFAAPPVGALRWRPPQAAASWNGERDASKAGGSCQQVEDCLYLNVHLPPDAKPGAKLPVMVWIHGGSFTGGTGATFDGNTFARRGVVLVTVNYRLGRMGYFAHPALTQESKDGRVSNYGAMDQIAALKWVQNNIGAFGGDAKNVTIFGESAGAISINYLMLSPDAKGLFSKAISESGFARYSSQTQADAEKVGAALAAKAGVSGDGPAALTALRKLAFNAMPNGSSSSDPGRPGPIIDGKVLTVTIPDGFAQGREAKVPYLLGGNSNEASFFRIQNSAERVAAAPQKDALLAAYDPAKTGNVERVANAMVTAQQITEPDRNAARAHTKNGAPTYLYYFSYLPPAQRATSMGAGHGAEISYVFNTLRDGYSPQDFSTSQSMNAYWAAFAKYGDPGAAGGPAWPKFDLAKEPSIEFANTGAKINERHLEKQLDWAQMSLGGRSTVMRTPG